MQHDQRFDVFVAQTGGFPDVAETYQEKMTADRNCSSDKDVTRKLQIWTRVNVEIGVRPDMQPDNR